MGWTAEECSSFSEMVPEAPLAVEGRPRQVGVPEEAGARLAEGAGEAEGASYRREEAAEGSRLQTPARAEARTGRQGVRGRGEDLREQQLLPVAAGRVHRTAGRFRTRPRFSSFIHDTRHANTTRFFTLHPKTAGSLKYKYKQRYSFTLM